MRHPGEDQDQLKGTMSFATAERYKDQFLIRNQLICWLALAILFATAFGIRAIGVTRIPLDYHPVKQYRAALTARAFFYESRVVDVPSWERDVATASLEEIGFLGPPIVDAVAAAVYSVLGMEALWIPRLLSSIYWIVGGFFLYALARKMMHEDGAIVSTALYLFLPFGVISSQSFQPDPLMIMLMIMSIYLIVRYREQPSQKSFAVMSILSALAILAKPVSLFIIFGAYFALQYDNKGMLKNLVKRENILFFLIAFFPSVLYYGYGILNTATLDQQAQKSFIPQLFLDFNFWDGWLKRIKISVGFSLFLGGMLGAFLYPAGWQKKLMLGLWAGYFGMCFSFNYTISTHDYYHLPLFPIIALSLGPAIDILMQNLRRQATNRWLQFCMYTVLFVALFLGAGTNVQALNKLPDHQAEITVSEKIGEAVSHSSNTIFLAPYDGKPLMYYGKLSGQYWPYWYDIRDEKLWGVEYSNPQERLQALSQGGEVEYFIVNDLDELENQSDLQKYLNENFPVLVTDPEFLIYDLGSVQ